MMVGAIGITGGDCFELNGFKRGSSNAFVFSWCEADDDDDDEDDWADIVVVCSKEDEDEKDEEEEEEEERKGLATTTFRVVRIKSMAAAVEDVVSFIFFSLYLDFEYFLIFYFILFFLG